MGLTTEYEMEWETFTGEQEDNQAQRAVYVAAIAYAKGKDDDDSSRPTTIFHAMC